MSLKIQNKFDDLRPYEKLEIYGEKSLTTAELLAIIIRNGTKKKTAIDVAEEVLCIEKQKDNLRFLDDVTLNQLKNIEGIGRVKAIQIKAVLEFSKRINKNRKKEKIKIRSTTDVIELFMEELRYEKQEILKIIILNNSNEIIKIKDLAKGNTDAISFDIKLVLEEPIKLQAGKFILIHNHPSGDPTPSNEDIITTRKIRECASLLGIKLLEHIVIGNGEYRSICK